MRTKFFLTIILGIFFCTACNNNNSTSSSTNTSSSDSSTTSTTITAGNDMSKTSDSTFLATAYAVGLFEIQIADIAQQNSQNAKVKTFADRMKSDHAQLNNEVKSVAQKMNIQLSEQLPQDLQAKKDDLNKLNGKDFDAKYADINVDGHKDAISKFEGASMGGYSSDVKNLATQALPKLKEHKEHSDMLQKEVKQSNS
jgi:putative membrane protein